MCTNRVDYHTVGSNGFSSIVLDYKCGTTGIEGEAVMCDECNDKIAKGKMNRPGYCSHGTKLWREDSDGYDVEVSCNACEAA
jgi:hypothetical protein